MHADGIPIKKKKFKPLYTSDTQRFYRLRIRFAAFRSKTIQR